MGIEEDMRARRAERRRRGHIQAVGVAVASAASVLSLVAYGDSPMVGVFLINLASIVVGMSLFANWHDEWHRHQALRGTAVAFLAGVMWLIGQSVWVELADGAPSVDPGRALACMAATWLLADYLLRQRSDGAAESRPA